MKEQQEPEKKEEKKEDKKEDKPKKPEKVVKKWKGKDWFTIFSPKSFGGNVIAETPATDPKTLTGRSIEVSLSEILGQRGKDHQKLKFKVDRIDGKSVHTKFSGYMCIRESISRIVRKRLQKIEIIGDVKTKDGWVLQISSIAVMNSNVEKNIQRKVRAWVSNQMVETAGKSGIDEFVKLVMAGTMQYKMKKQGSKIYPVRFFEIIKIEIVKEPEK